MTNVVVSRVLMLCAIVALICGFKCDCYFLYVGTILVIFSEVLLWKFLIFNMIYLGNLKNED